MVERWFRDITAKRIRRVTFQNVPQLIEALESFITTHNASGTAFAWTAKADDIPAKVEPARAALNKTQSD